MRRLAVVIFALTGCHADHAATDGPVDATSDGPVGSRPCEVEGGPWLHTLPAPRRERFVSPAGGGDGTSEASPMALAVAIAEAMPGDRVWLTRGEYAGEFELAADGTEADPIVYRAVPGHHAVIRGAVSASGDHTWVWGLDITDPDGTPVAVGASLQIFAAHVHAINNVLHNGSARRTAVSAFRTGVGQVIYGNAIFDSHHNIYTQNDFAADGPKYFVGNISFDALPRDDGSNGPFELHAYTEGSTVSGFHLEANVFANFVDPDGGRVLLGGYNLPADREVVAGNVFYRSSLQLGYRRPAQARVTGNYFLDAPIIAEHFWGTGETLYPQSAPNEVTDNEIHTTTRRAASLVSSAYVANGVCGCTAQPCQALGCPALQPTDVWDRNTYSRFDASFHAGGVEMAGGVDLPSWRALTAAAGNGFDATSVEVPPPTGITVRLIRNAYAPARAHLVVINHEPAADAAAAVDLSTLARPGDGYTIHPIRDPFGEPVAAGAYAGSPVSVPAPRELQVYLVRVTTTECAAD